LFFFKPTFSFLNYYNLFNSVRAIDGDRGINNKIKYSILSGGNNMFKIDEDTGVISTLKQLDREDSRNLINGAYILEILATERSKLKVIFLNCSLEIFNKLSNS
jgi:hypothetical protein